MNRLQKILFYIIKDDEQFIFDKKYVLKEFKNNIYYNDLNNINNNNIKPYEGIFINEILNNLSIYLNDNKNDTILYNNNELLFKKKYEIFKQMIENIFNFINDFFITIKNNSIDDINKNINTTIPYLIYSYQKILNFSKEFYDYNKKYDKTENNLIKELLDFYIIKNNDKINDKIKKCDIKYLFYILTNNDSNEKCYKQYNLFENNSFLFDKK